MDAVILDLDGVITRTATLHAEAWRRVMDDVLRRHAAATGSPFVPFDIEADYRQHVDGKPREAGARDFLDSRGVILAGEQPGVETPIPDSIADVSSAKDGHFHDILEERGVPVAAGAVEQLRRWRARNVSLALVTSSRNAGELLERTGLRACFDVVIDGVVAAELGLHGKPAPDTFVEAARRLGVPPERAAVVEDAAAGVEAARRGGFGSIVGVVDPAAVDPAGDARRLRDHGAHVIVSDLRELGDSAGEVAEAQRSARTPRSGADERVSERPGSSR